MPIHPLSFPKEIRPLRFERTEIEGLAADYFFCREADRSYSLSVFSEGREAHLPCFTAHRLVAEAFYLLVKEEGVLPATLDELWQEFSSEMLAPKGGCHI